jgi:hypothetical protein
MGHVLIILGTPQPPIPLYRTTLFFVNYRVIETPARRKPDPTIVILIFSETKKGVTATVFAVTLQIT